MLNPIYKKKKEIQQLESKIYSFYKENKYKECIDECERLSNVSLEKREIVYLYLGKCFMNLGNYEKSKQSFLFCLSLYDTNMECLINLGTISTRCNELEDAVQYLLKYNELNGLQNQNTNKYIICRVSYLQNISNVRFLQKDYEQTEAVIAELLEIKPKNIPALLLLAEVYLEKGEFDKSEEIFRSVLQRDGNSIAASFSLGRVLEKQEKFSEAVAQYEHSIQIDSMYFEIYKALGRVLFRNLQKYDEAIFNFENFVQLNKKDPLRNVSVLLDIGEVYETLFKSSYAIDTYLRASEINPNDVIPLIKIANIHFEKRQDFEQAKKYFEKIIRLKPSCKNSFIQLGMCLFHLKKYEKAIEVYKNALLLDSYNSQVFAAVALCYQNVPNLKEADIYFRLSLQINPFDISVKSQYEELKVLLD